MSKRVFAVVRGWLFLQVGDRSFRVRLPMTPPFS
uniref:Uncharacterized protein n=1 Tax=Mycolicibacterium phage phi1_186018 TaxID=3236641 RepID=A0AB39AKM4_9CAUD